MPAPLALLPHGEERARGRSAAIPGEQPPLAVWRLDLAESWELDEAAACLAPAEREHADRGAPAVRRRRILVRAALRTVLGELLAQEPAAVALRSENGRPVLDGPAGNVHVSCSAADDVGLVAVSLVGPVGVDVERPRPVTVRDAAAEGWLSAGEAAALRYLADPSAALTRCWVQKEAVLKAEGVGLHRDPAGVATPLADRGRIGPWSVLPVPVTEGYLGAVAVPASATPVPVAVRDLRLGGPR